MTTDTRALSRAVTEAVLGTPGVRMVIPPGPSLATLVRDVRSVLDLPRGGGAVLIEERPDGVRVRAVVGVGSDQPALTTVRAVRDAVVATVERTCGTAPSTVTVRVVEIS